jgi:hypothetical protein
MTAPSDKELKRLVTCENGGFTLDVVEMARELLAARKVVYIGPVIVAIAVVAAPWVVWRMGRWW